MIVGWFVGLALLWSSKLWTIQEKLIGTLVVPFGLAAAIPALYVFSEMVACGDPPPGEPFESGCTAAYSWQEQLVWGTLLGLCVIGPVCATIFLARRMRRRRRVGYQPSPGSA
jgi:hypothetical protein